MIRIKSLFLREGKPTLLSSDLKLDSSVSPPRVKFGIFSQDVGINLGEFAARILLPPFGEFFASEGITASSIILEVTHIIELTSSELSTSSRIWSISPKLRGSVTKRHFSTSHPSGGGCSRNSRSPYLLMERESVSRFGWINDTHIDKKAGHPDILKANPGFEERGGGEILLTQGVLSLHSSSSNFGHPSLERLKDAASAVVASLVGRVRVKSVFLEGIVEHEFSL
ncbi:hypothetical protein HZC08_01370 [Candidatus Micrarchaeota archaeon]|nr:hypothetical protein [Candidatus Micrarchaeota archaeon]